MIYLLGLVALVLASARLTRVFNIDEIAAPLRTWIIRRYGEQSKPGKIVRCYWCAGFWISGAATIYTQTIAAAVGWLPWETLALLPVTWPAVAYASAWILDKEVAADGA